MFMYRLKDIWLDLPKIFAYRISNQDSTTIVHGGDVHTVTAKFDSSEDFSENFDKLIAAYKDLQIPLILEPLYVGGMYYNPLYFDTLHIATANSTTSSENKENKKWIILAGGLVASTYLKSPHDTYENSLSYLKEIATHVYNAKRNFGSMLSNTNAIHAQLNRMAAISGIGG